MARRRKRRLPIDASGAWVWNGRNAWVWYLDRSIARTKRGWRIAGQYASSDQARAAILQSIAERDAPDAFRVWTDAYKEGRRWVLLFGTVSGGLSARARQYENVIDAYGAQIDFEAIDPELHLRAYRAWEQQTVADHEPWYRWLSTFLLVNAVVAGGVFIYPNSANVREMASQFSLFGDQQAANQLSRQVATANRRFLDDVKWFGVQGWFIIDNW